MQKKKKREINKTPVTLEAHFNMPDYLSAIQFLYFFKQLRALDDTSSLEQAQRNDKKIKRYINKPFSYQKTLEIYSGNRFTFIWNEKVFWKKRYSFGFYFNRSPHIHLTT